MVVDSVKIHCNMQLLVDKNHIEPVLFYSFHIFHNFRLLLDCVCEYILHFPPAGRCLLNSYQSFCPPIGKSEETVGRETGRMEIVEEERKRKKAGWWGEIER